ncbi:MAG: beta-glucosidase [Calditrichaeota bacterium]|nr:MAG: beta-glucosidase [Calditrichota bacterium]
MKRFSLILLMTTILINTSMVQMTEEELDEKVNHLLSRMTLEEKVGQMTQITLEAVSARRGTATQKHRLDLRKLEEAIVKYHVGSILNVYDVAHTLDYWHTIITTIQDIATKKTRLGIPVIYGIDAIHGANYTREATLFPQSIAMAATRNPELVKKCAEITAFEVRASGIPWNFSPILGVARTPLWPRFFETYGEDPYLVSQMGAAYIKGMEGETNQIGAPDRVAACMKHYLGYSFPLSGKDRTPAWIPERMLREIFLPPFQKAVEAGVHTVMVNSSEINGIPVHSDYHLLTEVLKEELGFKGFVVSDWEDINRLYSRDKVASSRKEAVRMAVMAGVDMSMVPFDFSFYEDLLQLVKEGKVPVARIDDAVSRILRVKFQLNLFENPYPKREMKEQVGNPESANVSLEAAHQAITLLKNVNKILPLKKTMNILVTGPTANMRSVLNGGWTYTWQGNEEVLYPRDKPTILEAIRDKVGDTNVKYLPGASFSQLGDLQKVKELAKQQDVAVVCLGETPYCETPGNIHDLTLPEAQLKLVEAIAQTGTPVILVLVEGRPRIFTRVVGLSQGILMAYLPGPEGGRAIADVLFGDVNPSGKLPFTYPRHPNDLVCYDHKPIEMDDPNKLDPLFPFGYGLSYTTFAYSNLVLDRQTFYPHENLTVKVTVTNTGDREGREIVELYVRDVYRSVSPPVRQLKRFTSVTLAPGEEKVVQFTLSRDDFAFWGRDNRMIVEPGEFWIMVGGQTATTRLLPLTEEASK